MKPKFKVGDMVAYQCDDSSPTLGVVVDITVSNLVDRPYYYCIKYEGSAGLNIISTAYAEYISLLENGLQKLARINSGK